MKLPLSRLQDGICDCCDGADEAAGVCNDICDVVLAEERAKREKAKTDYAIGSQKRKEEIAAFATFKQGSLVKMSEIENTIAENNQKLEGVKAQIEAARLAYVGERRTQLTSIVRSGFLESILSPLNNQQLALLIQLTCQLAGELPDAKKGNTCVPLRLAGVELGMTWDEEDFAEGSAELSRNDDEEGQKLISKLIEKNTNGDEIWNPDDVDYDKKRRRLDDYHREEDDEYDYGDYEGDDYHGDDDYEPPEPDHEDPPNDEDDEADDEDDEIRKYVKGSNLSIPRTAFLTRASQLVTQIEDFIDLKDKEEEEATAKMSEATEEEKAAMLEDETPPFDSSPYENVKDKIAKRKSAIKLGFDYAVSAAIIVNSVHENHIDLLNLAGITLAKSKLSMGHVWQMLNVAVNELGLSYSEDDQTCASPLSRMCPPKSTQLEGKDYPPAAVIAAGETACERAVDEAVLSGCGAASDGEPISNLPDGYYGYYETHPASEGDVLFSIAAGIDAIAPAPTFELLASKNQLDETIRGLNDQFRSLDDEIGGRDGNKFGPDGELSKLKDSCHFVTEGKYDYEICIFGLSQQKEKGAASGTSLGNWREMTIEDGQRVMKWENGQKCWNGPKRSATAYITCGAETKVLSAEEPDTCRYELQVESHIACDDAYFQKYLA